MADPMRCKSARVVQGPVIFCTVEVIDPVQFCFQVSLCKCLQMRQHFCLRVSEVFDKPIEYARNDDFVVLTARDDTDKPDRAFAKQVMEKATELRRQIATEWLGNEIPPGIGRTHLTVMITADQLKKQ